ncbi:hypothetical protein MKZ38_008505 [Zalerion maritima]|uniref:Major facilitator superfamily (MFS) profile domain-containing protein n=1 Tax=Zalerion maritima TaxID=339359 RepID=A0AAD5WME8_9PEZI|nr:hypothetical protein MKZ38_008505 [Zalerion maritima]
MFLSMSYGVYFFFASLMIISAVYVFFVVPETKSIPLESMGRLFEIKPVWKANEQLLAELGAEDEEFRHNADGAGLGGEKERASVDEFENKGAERNA